MVPRYWYDNDWGNYNEKYIKAYNLGFEDAQNGKSISDNPYIEVEERYWWDMGWGEYNDLR